MPILQAISPFIDLRTSASRGDFMVTSSLTPACEEEKMPPAATTRVRRWAVIIAGGENVCDGPISRNDNSHMHMGMILDDPTGGHVRVSECGVTHLVGGTRGAQNSRVGIMCWGRMT